MTETSAKPQQTGTQRLLTELGPLLVFFGVNWVEGIFAATAAFMVAMVAAMAFAWHKTRHVPPMLWVSTALVLVFGSLTLALADETFIKIKPTLVYTIFAAVLGIGLLRGRLYLRTLLGAAFPPMSERGWIVLTRNWAVFFVAMAGVNELVWRAFSTDVWVAFKVFGAIPLTFLFALAQAPVLMKHGTAEDAAE